MTRSAPLLFALALLCAACASRDEDSSVEKLSEAPLRSPAEVRGEPEAERAASTTNDAPAGETPAALTSATKTEMRAMTAGAPVQRPQEQRPAPQPRSAAEQDLWNDPKFRKRFAESYLSETEIEPRITTKQESELLQKVFALITDEKLEEARKLIVENREEAGSAVFDFTLGNIARQQERFENALVHYRAAIEKFPKFRRAWSGVGQISYHQGEFKGVLEGFTKVLELGGGDAYTYGLLGVAHGNLDNPLAAESAFRMANLMDPENLGWKVGMAKALIKQQRFAEAIASFGTLIKAHPDRAEFWLAQGEAYAMTKQPLKAAENFEMVDRLGGSSFRSLNNLGDIYAMEKHFDLAASAYLRALKKDPTAKLDRTVRAATFLGRNGAHREVETLVDGILELREKTIDADTQKKLEHLKARVALAQGHDEKQASILETILEKNPLDGDALILLGENAARSEQRERAVLYFERAASLEAFEAKAKLKLAELLVREGKYKEALPLIKRSLALDPRSHVRSFLEQVERAASR